MLQRHKDSGGVAEEVRQRDVLNDQSTFFPSFMNFCKLCGCCLVFFLVSRARAEAKVLDLRLERYM